MTALCTAGGPSQPKAGVQDDIIYATGYLGLIDLAPGFQWLIPFIPLLGNLAYHTPDLCVTDPPGFPTFTAGDAVALATADPGQAGHDARQKVSDVLTTIAWYTLCECVSGTQPTQPSATTEPTQPTINLPAGPASSTCASFTLQTSGTVSGVQTFLSPDEVTPIPSTASLLHISLSDVVSGSGGHPGHVQWVVEQRSSSGTQLKSTSSAVLVSPGNYVMDVPTVPGCYFPRVAVSFGPGISGMSTPTTSTDIFTAVVDVYCNGDPVGGPAPVCGVDPLSADLLRQILAQVTLIQRYRVPFAYVPGASHSALSGHGTLTVPNLVGVLITLTTVPGWIGTELGSPTELFEAGWFSWGNADGFVSREIITHNPQLSLPAEAPQYTRIGYSFSDGVIATIQELYAEP